MVDLNPRQFHMMTNMKAAPNSQGTLFQGGNPTPATGKPWPRGFSPERRDEVAKMLGGYPRNPGKLSAEGRQGVDNIARSTVPAEHLAGLFANFHDSDVLRAGDGRAGDYRKQGRALGLMRIAPGQAGGTTPIHEIGHHVSARIVLNAHAAYDTPSRRGTEEAYAENYAETHARDRRGRPVRIDKGPGGWSEKEATPEARREFRGSFYAGRAAGAPEHSSWRPLPMPPEHHQEELLRRFASGNGEYHFSYRGDSDLERETPGADEANARQAARNRRQIEMRRGRAA